MELFAQQHFDAILRDAGANRAGRSGAAGSAS